MNLQIKYKFSFLLVSIFMSISSIGQNTVIPLPKSVNWQSLSNELIDNIISKMSDSIRLNPKDIKNVCLLNYEQDFSASNTIISNYVVLFTIYHPISGHAVKGLATDNYLVSAVLEENFNDEELKKYIQKHGGSEKVNFYKDICPWREFKSYNHFLQIDKIIFQPKILQSIW